MGWVKISKKFPKWTLLLAIVCVILGLVVLGMLFPGVGASLLGFANWLVFDIFVAGIFWLATPQVAVALVLAIVVIGLYVYVKKYRAKKVFIATAPVTTAPLQQGLQQSVFNEDTKVESA